MAYRIPPRMVLELRQEEDLAVVCRDVLRENSFSTEAVDAVIERGFAPEVSDWGPRRKAGLALLYLGRHVSEKATVERDFYKSSIIVSWDCLKKLQYGANTNILQVNLAFDSAKTVTELYGNYSDTAVYFGGDIVFGVWNLSPEDILKKLPEFKDGS